MYYPTPQTGASTNGPGPLARVQLATDSVLSAPQPACCWRGVIAGEARGARTPDVGMFEKGQKGNFNQPEYTFYDSVRSEIAGGRCVCDVGQFSLYFIAVVLFGDVTISATSSATAVPLTLIKPPPPPPLPTVQSVTASSLKRSPKKEKRACARAKAYATSFRRNGSDFLRRILM
ncbi:hypothetical protein CBL_03508 [Carabus blaptoides fortunei]